MTQAPKTRWVLELYISENSGESRRVQENMKELMGHLKAGTYRVSVIVIEKHPGVLEKENIRMLPFFIRRSPTPVMRMVTSFEDKAEVAEIMGFSKEIPAKQLMLWRTESKVSEKVHATKQSSYPEVYTSISNQRIPSPTARDTYLGARSGSWNLRDALIQKGKQK